MEVLCGGGKEIQGRREGLPLEGKSFSRAAGQIIALARQKDKEEDEDKGQRLLTTC